MGGQLPPPPLDPPLYTVLLVVVLQFVQLGAIQLHPIL